MSEPEYVAIEDAGRLTGVPARTLRRWAEAGKVPVVAGQRKRLVRLEDVRRLAAMTGHQPVATDVTGASAGQATGHVADGIAGDNTLAAGSIAPTPQAYLEEIRDEWLQPLINQLKEAERTIGRLEQERDQLRAELTAAQAAVEDAPQDANRTPVGDVPMPAVSDSLVGRLRRLIGR
jgi:DNA-binding transcriptional MerR regulator